jgi:3-phenylpropionate/cinnamic acid dioxygenase small subunit
MALESQGMMKDRVYGITQTIYHGPYYMRHVVSPAQVLAGGWRGDPAQATTRCSAPSPAA